MEWIDTQPVDEQYQVLFFQMPAMCEVVTNRDGVR